jgi:hypothetical protein
MLQLVIAAATLAANAPQGLFHPDVPFQQLERAYRDCLAAVTSSEVRRDVLEKNGWKPLPIKFIGDDAPPVKLDIRARSDGLTTISLPTKEGEVWCSVSAPVNGESAYNQLVDSFAGSLSDADSDGKRIAIVDGRKIAVSFNREASDEGTIIVRVSALEQQ